MSRTTKRFIAVSLAFLLVAFGLWFWFYSIVEAGPGETYKGPIRLTSATVESEMSMREAKRLKRKFRIERVAKHYRSVGGTGKKSATTVLRRRMGACYTETAHNKAGHLLLMNVTEIWAQFHWCQKKSNPSQISLAKVQATHTDKCCMLNPWFVSEVNVFGGRYWDANAYSEIARKVVVFTWQRKLGPLGLDHSNMYIDCRLNALHGWFRCHMGLGATPEAWTPEW